MSTEVVYLLRCLVVTWLVPRETAAVSARSVHTIHTAIHYVMSLHTKTPSYLLTYSYKTTYVECMCV